MDAAFANPYYIDTVGIKMSVCPASVEARTASSKHAQPFSWGQMVSMGPESLTVEGFIKILIFGHFVAIFGSKLTPKCPLSINREAIFFGGYLRVSGTENVFIRGSLNGVRSLVRKFAFLVP